jgi:drug/metabolite transporter, DME family
LTLMAAGVVNMLTNLAVFTAFARTSVAVVVIILYSYPALVTIGANRLWGEPIDRSRGMALVLASAGLLLVVLAPVLGGSGVDIDPVGLLLAAAGATLQATYTLLAARGFPAIPSLLGSTLILGIVVLCNVAAASLLGASAQLIAPIEDPSLMLWVIVSGVIGAAIPGVALMMGIRRLGPSRAAILMMLEPVVAVLLAGLFLAEQPSSLQIVGGLMVIAAGVILQLPGRGPRWRLRARAGA